MLNHPTSSPMIKRIFGFLSAAIVAPATSAAHNAAAGLSSFLPILFLSMSCSVFRHGFSVVENFCFDEVLTSFHFERKNNFPIFFHAYDCPVILVRLVVKRLREGANP